MVEYVVECAAQARSSFGGAFRLRSYVAGAIQRFADPLRTPALLDGNMEVSVTSLPFLRNHRLTDFSTWTRTQANLLATSCLVPLAGLPMRLPGLGFCFDGGLTDFQPVRGWRRSGSFNKVHEGCAAHSPSAARRARKASEEKPRMKAAITACPFYMSRAAIKPDCMVPLHWCFYPPEPAKLRDLYAMGERNAAAWVAAQASGASDHDSPAQASRWQEYAAAARAAAHGAAAEAAELSQLARRASHGVAAFAEGQRTVFVSLRERCVKTLCCALIYVELLAQAAVSAACAALPQCLLGRRRQDCWERCKSFAAPLPGLASYALAPPRSLAATQLLAAQAAVLAQLSLLYRLFAHTLA